MISADLSGKARPTVSTVWSRMFVYRYHDWLKQYRETQKLIDASGLLAPLVGHVGDE